MAGIVAGTKFKVYDNPGSGFTKTHKPGGKVEYSGIYKCVNCGREITSNMHTDDDTFPPHNTSSTCNKANGSCTLLQILWAII